MEEIRKLEAAGLVRGVLQPTWFILLAYGVIPYGGMRRWRNLIWLSENNRLERRANEPGLCA